MPVATEYSTGDRAQQDIAKREIEARAKLHALNLKYYHGQHAKPLKIIRGVDDNVLQNWCGQAVDSTLSFLFPSMPRIETGDTALDEAANRLWAASGGVTLLGKIALNGALTGHAFARLVDEDPIPRIVNLNPQFIIKWVDKTDTGRLLWYEQQWADAGGKDKGPGLGGETKRRKDFVPVRDANGNIVNWEIVEYVLDGPEWVRNDSPVMWGAAAPPIADWQHLPVPNTIYGAHELPHARLNDDANRIASNINRIIRFHAYPRTIGTGMRANDVEETGVNGFWAIPSKDARIQNLEMRSDLGASMAMLDRLKSAFFRQSRVIIPPGEIDAFRGVTNLGIRATYMPMIAKNSTLRRQYGEGIKALTRTGLALMGFNLPDDLQITLEWGEALPIDEAEEFRLIDQMRTGGYISMQTARGRLGLDSAFEDELIMEEMARYGAAFEGQTIPGVMP